MRVAVISGSLAQGGPVVSAHLLSDGLTIDPDGRAARGQANLETHAVEDGAVVAGAGAAYEAVYAAPDGCVLVADPGGAAMPGSTWTAAVGFVAPPAPPPAVPALVWDWQFAGQASAEGVITAQEALDWVGGGHVPASLAAAVDTKVTDPDQHAKVMLFLTGASQFPRAHPLVSVLGAAFGKDSDAKLDAFFVAAGAR